MNLTKRALAVFALTSVFAMTSFASEPNPASCSPLDGIMQTPPCASAQSVTDDPRNPEQLKTPPASNTVDITSTIEEALIAFLLF